MLTMNLNYCGYYHSYLIHCQIILLCSLLRIIQADTYIYSQQEDTPSYDEIRSVKTKAGECFNNVKHLSKFLTKKNIEHDIYLTFGMRDFAEGVLSGYHYVIGDRKYNRFFDNQYFRWNGIVAHKWTPKEYFKEKFVTSEFADHYLIIHRQTIVYTMMALKRDLSYPFRNELSNEKIKKWSFSADITWAKPPKYGIDILGSKKT
jgi:hypothetical protein